MLVIPKLELLSGASVRTGAAGGLGSDDPLTAARGWAAEGFSRVQIVDRDALAERGSNVGLVESISLDGGFGVDLSAGSDSAEQIESWLETGASRVVLGARALAEEEWLRDTATTFPDTLIVETKVRERRVVTRGWVRTLAVDLLELVENLAGLPLAAVLVTAPAGGGLELALLEDVVDACSVPVLVEDLHPTMNAFRAFEHRGLAAVVGPGAAFATALDPHSVASEFGR